MYAWYLAVLLKGSCMKWSPQRAFILMIYIAATVNKCFHYIHKTPEGSCVSQRDGAKDEGRYILTLLNIYITVYKIAYQCRVDFVSLDQPLQSHSQSL